MTTKQIKGSKTWNIGLWIAQIALAAMFLQVGIMKTFLPMAELVKIIPLAAEHPGLLRFIGISELAGGLGLLLPSGLRIVPWLSTVAAAALGFVMVLALGFHAMRGESIVVSGALLIVAGFIVWGRIYKAPITSRASQKISKVNY